MLSGIYTQNMGQWYFWTPPTRRKTNSRISLKIYKSKFLIYTYRSTTFFLLWHSLLTLVWCCCILKQCPDVLYCQAKWWPAPQGQEAFGNRLELQVCQATLGLSLLWVLCMWSPKGHRTIQSRSWACKLSLCPLAS
jgi:hypothetical protein